MTLYKIIDCKYQDREQLIYLLSHKDQVSYGLWCANVVKHLSKDERVHKALEVIALWLEDKATKKQVQDAATAATAAATTSTAAYYAATAAATAAYSTSTYYAANAYEEIKEKQLLYLKKLCLKKHLGTKQATIVGELL